MGVRLQGQLPHSLSVCLAAPERNARSQNVELGRMAP
jgi:hypothetical protein